MHFEHIKSAISAVEQARDLLDGQMSNRMRVLLGMLVHAMEAELPRQVADDRGRDRKQHAWHAASAPEWDART